MERQKRCIGWVSSRWRGATVAGRSSSGEKRRPDLELARAVQSLDHYRLPHELQVSFHFPHRCCCGERVLWLHLDECVASWHFFSELFRLLTTHTLTPPRSSIMLVKGHGFVYYPTRLDHVYFGATTMNLENTVNSKVTWKPAVIAGFTGTNTVFFGQNFTFVAETSDPSKFGMTLACTC